MAIATDEAAQTLTKQERELRKRFVEEYVVDYNAVDAAIRIGFNEQFAVQYAKKFLSEPYTLKLIKEQEEELGQTTDEERHRKRVIAGLYREAHSRFNNGSAKVAAFTQIAKIVGIEAPVKTQQLLPQVGQIDLTKYSDEELEQLEALLAKGSPDAANPESN